MDNWKEFVFNEPFAGGWIGLINNVILLKLYVNFINYFNAPIMMDEEDVTVLGNDIDLLPDKINDLWKQQIQFIGLTRYRKPH